MNKLVRLFLVGLILLVADSAAQSQTSSIYTNLTGSDCKTVKSDDETGSSVQNCRGLGKWSLKVLDDDNRMSINIVAPNGKESELDFWTVITGSFSSLGTKAEWRVRKEKNESLPVALIVRVNSSSEQNGKTVRQSFLAVTKITAAEICVVDKIEDRKNANQLARLSADSSADKPCLQQ